MKFLLLLLIALLPQKLPAVNPEVADPTIFRDSDGTFYLYGTESDSNHGIPVYKSSSITGDWTFMEQRALTAEDAFGSKWFWAPQIFRHDGRYYMFYTADEQIAWATADTPAGPFKGGARIESTSRQIDPYVFFDDNMTPYLYFVRLENGNNIFAARLTTDLTAIIDSTVTHCITASLPWENTAKSEWPVAEGPTVIRRGAKYHLFYSVNDFRNPDYAVGHATAPTPLGPWTKDENPLIDRNLTNRNGTGHGDIISVSEDKIYYVFHTHESGTQVSPRNTWIVQLDPHTLIPLPGSVRPLQVKE